MLILQQLHRHVPWGTRLVEDHTERIYALAVTSRSLQGFGLTAQSQFANRRWQYSVSEPDTMYRQC
jgi:phosphomevalonate kinase